MTCTESHNGFWRSRIVVRSGSLYLTESNSTWLWTSRFSFLVLIRALDYIMVCYYFLLHCMFWTEYNLSRSGLWNINIIDGTFSSIHVSVGMSPNLEVTAVIIVAVFYYTLHSVFLWISGYIQISFDVSSLCLYFITLDFCWVLLLVLNQNFWENGKRHALFTHGIFVRVYVYHSGWTYHLSCMIWFKYSY